MAKMKIDDASWHETTVTKLQAAAHIAPVFIWLVSNGYIRHSELDAPRDWRKELADRKMSPAEFFDYFSDSKLIVDEESEITDFLNDCYMEQYVPAVLDDTNLEYDSRFNEPYNLKDSWENCDRIATILDNLLKDWRSQSSGKSFLKRLFTGKG